MHRRTGTRLTIAAGLAVGLSFSIAPQWVSGSTDTADTADVTSDGSRPAAAVTVDEQVWPIDLHEATPVTSTAVPPPEPEAPVAPVTLEPVEAVPVVEDPPPGPAPAPAPAETADVRSAGTIHVDVVAVTGATRSVSLTSADGTPVAGPIAVDGNGITFADVTDGAYDVFVEETADEGGTYLTRTNLLVSGGELVVSCDAETLDCSVS